MSTPTTTSETVTVPSEALKAFIKATSEIVAEALEADVNIDAELEDRWLQAAGGLQKAVEAGKASKEDFKRRHCGFGKPCGCMTADLRFSCTLDVGHTGDHEAASLTSVVATWPQES